MYVLSCLIVLVGKSRFGLYELVKGLESTGIRYLYKA
jgi:hypothetical protein